MELKYHKVKMPNDTVVFSIDISYGDEILAVGQQSAASDKPSLTFWNFTADGVKATKSSLCFEEEYMIQNINFCNHNRYLIFNNILIYNLEEKKYIENKDTIEKVQYIKASNIKPFVLVSGAEIKILDIEKNTWIWSYSDEIKLSKVKNPVTIAGTSEDFNRVVIAGGSTKEIIIFDITKNIVIKKLANGPEMAGKVVVSNDYKYILSTGYLGKGLFLWDYMREERVLSDVLIDFESMAVCFINNSYIAIGMGDTLFIIDINKRDCVYYEVIHEGQITDIKVNYTKKFLVTSSADGYISFIDIKALLV